MQAIQDVFAERNITSETFSANPKARKTDLQQSETSDADIAGGPTAHEATEALPKDVSSVLIGSEAHAQKSTASNGRLCSLGVALLVGAAIAVPLLRQALS